MNTYTQEDRRMDAYNSIQPGFLDKLVARISKWQNRNQPKELTYADVYSAISKQLSK